jgi:protein-tyrosine phosphatase
MGRQAKILKRHGRDKSGTSRSTRRTAEDMMVGMEVDDRVLPLVGAYNFRDLGRYPTAAGQLTVWGRLFRSDTLHELTLADLNLLQRVGLAGVIDLRTTAEVERAGRGLLAEEPIRYLHASVLQEEGGETIAAPSGDDASERYLWYLDCGREALVAALEMVADPQSYPLVFHCTAGKDRTGVLAALVLDLLGVRREVIVEDYMLTATRIELIIARLRRDPRWGDRIDQVPASRLSVRAETMERFLNGLYQRHGGARQWALHAGVSEPTLDRLPGLLLE